MDVPDMIGESREQTIQEDGGRDVVGQFLRGSRQPWRMVV